MSLFEGIGLTCVRADRCVFQDLDFALGPGAALVVRGPNGSGKSSLLRLLAGLLKPAGGRLLWDGEAIDQAPETHRARLHYLGHQDAIKPVLRVAESLTLWTGLRGTSDRQVDAALERMALTELADLPCRMLSAGQRRRLALARLLAAPAELWLLDEPSAALDRAAVARLTEEITAHCAGGGRVILSTHEDLAIDQAQTLDLGRLDRPAAAELVW